jgi:hypothetical protein
LFTLRCCSGNLLLCEGCSNVAHPECAGLLGIPDGDWYCFRCVQEKGLSSAFQQSSEENRNTLSLTSDVESTPKPSSCHKEDMCLPKESAEEEKKREEVTDQRVDSVEQSLIDAIPSNAPEDHVAAVPKKDDTPPDGKVASPDGAFAELKKVPPPEITDAEFEAKESELYELVEGLSSQHEGPKPKPKAEQMQEDDDDVKAPESRRKRGRPRKSDAMKKSGGGGGGDPMESISAAARSFLESLSITTCEAFLAAGSTGLGEELIKWRKKHGMPPLKGTGHIATISGWKTIVRNSGAVEDLSDNSEEFAEVVPQSKPRSRLSIEKRAAVAPKSSSRRGMKRQRSASLSRPKTPRSNNLIENLPVQGQQFCEFIKITDAEEFLSMRTSELAGALVEFRRKAKMPTLAGSGPSAYVAMWKTELRRDVAYQKSVEEQRTFQRGKVQRGSKVQDVEEAGSSPETKRVSRSSNTSNKNTVASVARRSSTSNAASRTKKKDETDASYNQKNDADSNVSFNVLEETQKLALEVEEKFSESLGRRRHIRTNRYVPS